MCKQNYHWTLSGAAVVIAISAWLTAQGCGNSNRSGPRHRQEVIAAKLEKGLLRGAGRGSKGSRGDIQRAYAAMRTPPEPMSAGMRAKALATITGGSRLGLRFDLAQHLKTPVGSLWAVDGNTGVICLFQDDLSAGSCGTASNAIKFGMVLETYKRTPSSGRFHDFRALGIAPSWAEAVRVRVGGKNSKIRVVDNAFGYRAEHPIRIRGLAR
jgi:hypothetical protein